MSTDSMKILRAMVRGAYDLQMLRMQMGLRLCANFRAKLKKREGEPELDEETGELSEEALEIIVELKKSYRRLTEGVAKHRTLPARKGFIGDDLISTHDELTLIDHYLTVEAAETKGFRGMQGTLDTIPIYTEYLAHQRGIGPAMAACLIAGGFDIHIARYVSSFWKYSGMDLGPDGMGRSRRKEHLVERKYINRHGKEATRMGVTYNPWLKTKLLGVLAGSFLRSGSPWRAHYDAYKHRLVSDPGRQKVTLAEYKRMHAADEDTSQVWPPNRIHKASSRYMVKMFLAEFWAKWRAL
jgi:hypothetical protein